MSPSPPPEPPKSAGVAVTIATLVFMAFMYVIFTAGWLQPKSEFDIAGRHSTTFIKFVLFGIGAFFYIGTCIDYTRAAEARHYAWQMEVDRLRRQEDARRQAAIDRYRSETHSLEQQLAQTDAQLNALRARRRELLK